MPATAAYQEAADAIQEILQVQGDLLYSALDQPYFGRLDYFPKDIAEAGGELTDHEPDGSRTPLRTIYLGIVLIQDKGVLQLDKPGCETLVHPELRGWVHSSQGLHSYEGRSQALHQDSQPEAGGLEGHIPTAAPGTCHGQAGRSERGCQRRWSR